MEEKFPDFRKKKYCQIEIPFEINMGYTKINNQKLIYNPKDGKVLFHAFNFYDTGEDIKYSWVPLDVLLMYASWPFAKTGPWPNVQRQYFEEVSYEEFKEIEKNTLYLDD